MRTPSEHLALRNIRIGEARYSFTADNGSFSVSWFHRPPADFPDDSIVYRSTDPLFVQQIAKASAEAEFGNQ